MKRVLILGSTGSIGRSALEVIGRHRDRFTVTGLAARSNIEVLEEQIRIFHPEVVAVADYEASERLRTRVGSAVEVLAGQEGIEALASYENSDFVLSAMVGFSGLLPTLNAIRAGKTIGLANKETLVVAGEIIMGEARSRGVMVLPVDSEHSAVFQCLEGRDRKCLKKIILTASGGPFMNRKVEEFRDISPEEALRHPRWKMGKKVTIDSSTLMNKGLEVIEASHLFGLGPDEIEVIIHPESIIHSMVEFIDGTIISQQSVPDMKGPIAYALSYPERLSNIMPPLDLTNVGILSFFKPDLNKFPCLKYAYDALSAGGTMPAVLNASNEVAVKAFLDGIIHFDEIPVIINKTMSYHTTKGSPELNDIIEADRWARLKAEDIIRQEVR
ncbi:MAG: 1-deoxy-D-xylulose-5-phosphate reductoisomerase [Thermodesulfovibrionales bacterium]